MLMNSQMKAGRILRLQKGKRLFARMSACWDKGGVVRLLTHTRATDYKPKHRHMIRLSPSGSILMQAGKRWDCADFCTFQFFS